MNVPLPGIDEYNRADAASRAAHALEAIITGLARNLNHT